MERKLRTLFEYGRFQQNPRLEAMRRQAEARLAATALSEEQLGMVFAAGECDGPNIGLKELELQKKGSGTL